MHIPAIVQRKAHAAGADAWLRDLPTLVATLEDAWGIAVGDAYAGGTEAFVAPATQRAGTPAVLKLCIPRRDFTAAADEITTLRLADGHGCAQLLRADVARDALLLERLGPSLNDLRLPLAERQRILCDTLRRVWRPAPGAPLRSGAEKGRWLIDFITATWDDLGRPCSERAVAHALACAERRIAAHDDERAVLVHGDPHEWNALQSLPAPAGAPAPDQAFKLIDPDGLLAEPEYDLGILMREDPLELLEGDPWDRAHALATHTGRDATPTWEWGVVERVSSGLICTQIDLQPVGRDMLRAADRIARLEP